jgi:hypothetical protein
MKILLAFGLIVVRVIFGLSSYCQAEDLVFNQVLLYSVPGGQELVVPEGKVWKITTILNNDDDLNLWISINNGPPVRTRGLGANNYGAGGVSTPSPLWLPAGTIIEGYGKRHYVFSILEFIVK